MDEAFSDMLRQTMPLEALHCSALLDLAPRRPRRSRDEDADIMVLLLCRAKGDDDEPTMTGIAEISCGIYLDSSMPSLLHVYVSS